MMGAITVGRTLEFEQDGRSARLGQLKPHGRQYLHGASAANSLQETAEVAA